MDTPLCDQSCDDVRLATEDDIDELMELSPAITEHQAEAPVFGVGLPREDPDELRAEILEDLAKPELGDLVAELDGRIVGAFQLVPVELSRTHAGLARPRGAVLLSWAATRPEDRGSGAGVALTEASFALGARAGLYDDRDRLARDQPALVAVLARARFPADVPSPLPLDSLNVRPAEPRGADRVLALMERPPVADDPQRQREVFLARHHRPEAHGLHEKYGFTDYARAHALEL